MLGALWWKKIEIQVTSRFHLAGNVFKLYGYMFWLREWCIKQVQKFLNDQTAWCLFCLFEV